MSVPLKVGNHSEYPLILFTTCVPAAEGVVLWSLIAGSGFPVAFLALLLTTVGMIASVVHLAKPLRAPRSLANLASSWLSREIIAVSLFWGILVIWCLAALCMEGAFGARGEQAWTLGFLGAQIGSALMGGVLLYVIARAYHVSTRPAWCGYEGLAELWACALGAGSTGGLFVDVTTSWASSFSSGMGIVGSSIALVAMLALMASGGLAIDIGAFHARKKRLESMVAASDERVPLTLKLYGELMPRLRRCWWIEAASIVVAAIAMALWVSLDMHGVMAIMAFAAFCGQLYAHGSIRAVFYGASVPVRYVAALRK